MDATGLTLLLLLGMLLWLWHNTLRVRELALQAAHETCNHQQLQLLDGAVTLQRLRVGRVDRHPVLQRTFVFSYSRDGNERLTGFVLMAGYHVEQVGL